MQLKKINFSGSFAGFKLNYLKDIYLVGGAVRDLLLGKNINDLDFVCKCDLNSFEKVAKIFFYKNFRKKPFLIGKEFPPTYRVVLNGKTIDLTFLIKDFEIDAKRRDFTINAIYLELENNKIIDPLNGVNDLKKKLIRVCSEKSFILDPLRILRCFRLFANLNDFKIEKNTFKLLVKEKHLIKKVAKERIREEFDKIILSKKNYQVFLILNRISLLNEIIPEYNRENIPYIKKIFDGLNEEEIKIFVYALLVNKVNKTLLKFSNYEKKLIIFLQNGIKTISSLSSEKKIKEFILENKDNISILIKFIEKFFPSLENFSILKKSFNDFLEKKELIFNLINGHDVINAGVPEGKSVGKILKNIRLLIFLGKIKNREQALKMINFFLDN